MSFVFNSLSVLFCASYFLAASIYEAKGAPAEIKFGGVWLKGSDSQASARFPVGYKFIKQGESSTQSSGSLLRLIRDKQKPGGSRLIDQIAPDEFAPNAASGRALVVALAINYEHYEMQKMAGVRKIFAEVGFDLVLCDMSDRNVVFTLPGRLQYVDAGSGKKRGEQMLQYLYSEKMFNQFIKLAEYKWNGNLAFSTVGMSKLNVFDQARERFPNWMKSAPEAYYSQVIASTFYKTVGIPLLPYSKGEEVMYAMLREELSDSAAVKAKKISESANTGTGFILGKPDYTLEVTIPCFREVIAERTDLGSVSQYCAYSRFIIKDPTGKEIYNRKHDGNVTAILPNGTKLRPLWLSSSDATGEMFHSAAKKVKQSSSSAIKRMIREAKP